MRQFISPVAKAAKNVLKISLLSVLLCSCEGLQIERSMKTGPTDWGTFGGLPTRTNQSAYSADPPLHEVWQYEAGSGISATPLVQNTILVICTLKGELHAVDVQTGKRFGYVVLEGAVTGTPVWNRTSLYVPISTEKGMVESIDLTNGSINWISRLGQCESSLLLDGRNLYVTSLNGALYCLNSVNGDERWKFETGENDDRKPVRSSPALVGDVVVFGCDDGIVYAVDRTKGIIQWKYKTGQSIFASPIITSGRVIVGSLDGSLYCLAVTTGEQLWSFNTHSVIFGAASSNDSLAFVGTADGYCYALDVRSGSLVWKFETKSVVNAAPLVSQDLLYVGSLDKNLYVLNVRTGQEVWHFEAPGRIKVSPVLWNGMLLVTSEDNVITALRSKG